MAITVVTKKPGKTKVKTQSGVSPYGNAPGSSGRSAADQSAPSFYAPGQFWEMPKTDLGPPLQLQDMSGYTSTLNTLLTNPKYQIPAINYNQINKYASQAAGRDIGWEVGAYHTEQDRLRAAGAAQAALIQQAANAAARLAKPEAGNIQDAYLRSAGAMRDFSAAATGDLQSAGESENAKLIAQLQGLGSQQRPDAGQLSALNQATDAVGGLIPANTLAQQGASAYTAAAAMPDAFRGYGLQQGLGVRGAAQQEADKYNLDINKVIATRGKLTQDYATTLSEQAQARQKIATDTRNQQIELVGKLADITDKSNRTQIAVQGARIAVAKLEQAGVKLHNDTVKSQNTYNLNRSRIMESWRHNRITEAQRDDQLNLNAWKAQNAQYNANRSYGIAATNAQTGISNAQTARDNSRGYYFATDSKGNAVGLPQPTQNHKIVWESGVPGKGAFRSVLVHAPGTGPGAARRKSKVDAIKAATAILDEVVGGALPQGDQFKDRKGNVRIPGWDYNTHSVIPGREEDFISAGGKAPLSYWDAVNRLRHEGGDVLTVKEVRKLLDERYTHPGVAAHYNMTASENENQKILQGLIGWQGGPDQGKPGMTGFVPPPQLQGRTGQQWSQASDPVVQVLFGGLAKTKSGRFVDTNRGIYVQSSQQALSGSQTLGPSWGEAWQGSNYVRPAAEFLGGLFPSGGTAQPPVPTLTPSMLFGQPTKPRSPIYGS